MSWNLYYLCNNMNVGLDSGCQIDNIRQEGGIIDGGGIGGGTYGLGQIMS